MNVKCRICGEWFDTDDEGVINEDGIAHEICFDDEEFTNENAMDKD